MSVQEIPPAQLHPEAFLRDPAPARLAPAGREAAIHARAGAGPREAMRRRANRITNEVPVVVSVTCSLACKPPSCIEAV